MNSRHATRVAAVEGEADQFQVRVRRPWVTDDLAEQLCCVLHDADPDLCLPDLLGLVVLLSDLLVRVEQLHR